MRIVLAVDVSPLAEHALGIIGPWAATNDVDVDVLSVVSARRPGQIYMNDIPIEVVSRALSTGRMLPGTQAYPRIAESRGQALERARSDLLAVLTSWVNKYLDGVPSTVHVESGVDVAEAICQYAARRQAAAIVMGTRARSSLHAALFGSVSGAVIHRSPVPVMVVRQDMKIPLLEGLSGRGGSAALVTHA